MPAILLHHSRRIRALRRSPLSPDIHIRYCMCMMEHRLQILLDDHRYRRVASEAARRGLSIAALLREAIDRLPSHHADRRTAITAILAAEPMSLPTDPAELRYELDSAHDRVSA